MLLEEVKLPVEIPELFNVFYQLIQSEELKEIGRVDNDKLNSNNYKFCLQKWISE